MLIASEHTSGVVGVNASSCFRIIAMSLINRVVIVVLLIVLMTLLVHLRVLAIGRLGITVVEVSTRTFVRVFERSLLCHALRKTWTLRAVLRSR